MANPYSRLTTSLDYGLNTLFNRNSAPQKMPLGAPQIQKQIGPDGFWDRQTGGKRGPVDPLQADKDKKRALEKNIITNQIQHVQYINAVHVMVPIRLPNTESNATSWLDLAKSIHAGDVVFALRCPPKMVAASYASRLTKKTQYNYVSSVNLATLNYILFRLQTFFLIFREKCIEVDKDMEETAFMKQLNEVYENEYKKSPSKWGQWLQWFNFLGDGVDMNDLMGIAMILSYKDSATTTFDTNCFLKQWFDFAKEVDGNKGTDKRSEKLGRLFDARLESLLWGWIHGTCNILGIFIGSDEQGGAHQESKNPAVSWPNDYVGTVQVTGKSRRTSNLWNRDNDFSGGEALGFVLKKREFGTVDGKKVDLTAFRLSSNPNTAVDVMPHGIENLYEDPKDIENSKGFFFYLCPATLNAVQKQCAKFSADEPCCPPSFWQFCCANQHSKKMLHLQEVEHFATDAITIGNAPPIEIIMRRVWHDHRSEKIEYLEELLEDTAVVAAGGAGGGFGSVLAAPMLVASMADVTAPVHDIPPPPPDEPPDVAATLLPSETTTERPAEKKKREKKKLDTTDMLP